MSYPSGRHFLQIPGPTNVPDRVLRAIDRPAMDHRGPEFARFGLEIIGAMKTIFKTEAEVVIFPGSGTGASEAALVNTLSPGDHVLIYETGHFSELWCEIAENLGLKVEFLPGDWRHGADPQVIETRLADDGDHAIKAICIVHNDTSTGITSRVAEIRAAMDHAGHPALLIVDAVSSLASIDYRHDEWRVDVSVTGSQKGLMVPPGLGINAISAKAIKASESASLPKNYWSWAPMLEVNKTGFFRYTPATHLLYGLGEAITMLHEEGLENVFARHIRHGEATRRAVTAWGLEVLAADPAEYSPSVTTVLMPDGLSADGFRKVVLDNFDMSLGSGLSKIADKVFRIGHLGHFNDLMLTGTLSGIEMALSVAGVPHQKGGAQAAIDYLAGQAKGRGD